MPHKRTAIGREARILSPTLFTDADGHKAAEDEEEETAERPTTSTAREKQRKRYRKRNTDTVFVDKRYRPRRPIGERRELILEAIAWKNRHKHETIRTTEKDCRSSANHGRSSVNSGEEERKPPNGLRSEPEAPRLTLWWPVRDIEFRVPYIVAETSGRD